DVVTKILDEMDYINPEWLIKGVGSIYKEGVNIDDIPKDLNLFNQEREIHDQRTNTAEQLKEIDLKTPENTPQHPIYKDVETEKKHAKKITQIIIYYDDNTFEKFTP
ncbi:MAG TPA: hypothetical protein VKX35_00285, partial [Fermentimonas sp.]|nr:hypothetical protein [Fermentimonas sp.]